MDLHFIEIAVIGFLIGGLVGLTGMGGGSLLTPALILLFDVPPLTALGTGFGVGAVTRVVGGWNHWRLGNVEYAVVRQLLKGSLPGVVLGFGILKIIELHGAVEVDIFVRHAISAALFIVAVTLFYRSLWTQLQQRSARLAPATRNRCVRGYSFGASVLIGVSSVGTGTLLVPFLIAFFPASLPAVVGVNVVHGAVISGVSALLHGISGSINWLLALHLLIGFVPAVLLGSQLSVIVPRRVLEFILASMLLTTSIKLV